MPTNAGFLLMIGLGALLFLGKRTPMDAEEVDEGLALTTGAVAISPVGRASDDTSVIDAASVPDVVDIGGLGINNVTMTELAVRRSEQIAQQVRDWSVGAIPPPTSGPVPRSQGDIDAIKMAEGTFTYGGASRPTRTAIPVWNNTYKWYWKEPLGQAVGPGGKQWSPGDTATNMGSPGTNIGAELPPGWIPNRGGSATWVGVPDHDYNMA